MQRKLVKKSRWKKLSRYHSFYNSSFIPLCCMVALLALLATLVNSSLGISGDTNNKAYADEPMLLADTSTPSMALSIANPELSGYGKVGELVTVSSNVSIEANLISSYSLQISSSNDSSTTLEGPSTINPINNITNPNGVSGNNIPNDTWGYMWGDTNDSNNKYKGITTAPVTIDNSGINSTTGSINYTKPLTFAVKFSKDAIAGHYSTKVNLLLTATPRTLTTYTLTLNNNATSGITNAGTATTSKTCETYTDSCTISLSDVVTPTRTNYDFLGWADSNTATSAQYTTDGANGTANTVTLNSTNTTNSNKTIWAVWKSQGAAWTLPNGTKLYTGIEYMQDIDKATNTGGFCSSNLPNHSSITLKDKRDNNSYIIVKMADSKCWMTENLKLIGGSSLKESISSSNSQGTPATGWTMPSSSISGFSNNAASNAYLGKDNRNEDTGYYTWCTATAGTCSSVTSSNATASASICPKGWRLPGGQADVIHGNEFQELIVAENIETDSSGFDKIRGNPYYFALTGSVTSGHYYGPPDSPFGYWWSSTMYTGGNANVLTLNGNYNRIYPGNGNGSYLNGYAIRCITQ